MFSVNGSLREICDGATVGSKRFSIVEVTVITRVFLTRPTWKRKANRILSTSLQILIYYFIESLEKFFGNRYNFFFKTII